MEEFSFNALMALAWANKLITGGVISTLLAAILVGGKQWIYAGPVRR